MFPYRYEADSSKGPKQKIPWASIDGELVGDSELIIDRLSEQCNVNLDSGLSDQEAALGLCIRRLCEDHLHQVAEYELIVTDTGYNTGFYPFLQKVMPWMSILIGPYLRRHFRTQLYARGIARHSDEDIVKMGKADIDALSSMLGNKDWFVSKKPTLTDCAVFGQLSFFALSGLQTPVCIHAASKPNLVKWCNKVKDLIDHEKLVT